MYKNKLYKGVHLMSIKKIRVSNFKSFKELDIELSKFNVLIGANASGKSNFVHIFEFLRDIVNHGLDNAISMQGDVEYFRNMNIGSDDNFSLEIFSDQESKFRIEGQIKDEEIGVKIYEYIYKFVIKFVKKKYIILEDKLRLRCKFVRLIKQKEKMKEIEALGEGEIIIFVTDKREIALDLKKPENLLIETDKIPLFGPAAEFTFPQLPPKMTLINLLTGPIFTPFIPFLLSAFFKDFIYEFDPSLFIGVKFFKDISVYNIDPKLTKKAAEFSATTELEGDGRNLAIVLRNIIKDKEKKRKLFNLLRYILSFIDDLKVKTLHDRSLFVNLREIYSKEKFFPAYLISDGTINITALIIALYFEEKNFIIIEEPERNVHPYLISKVIEMMKDVSKEKQIIITTHNPEIVKHAKPEDIFLISRDKEGFSKICRPAEKTEIKIFLQNEMGIDELYVQNLLELKI